LLELAAADGLAKEVSFRDGADLLGWAGGRVAGAGEAEGGEKGVEGVVIELWQGGARKGGRRSEEEVKMISWES
jgi:hypothetical protein